MMQHKEISKMRRSTQFYRHKIHKYRHHAKDATPTLEQSQDGHEAQLSLDGSRMSSGVEENLSYSAVFSDADRESSVAPSEHLDDSFPAYTPFKADHSSSVTEALEKTRSSSKTTPISSWTQQGLSRRSQISVSPLTAASESVTEKSLKKSSAQDLTRLVISAKPLYVAVREYTETPQDVQCSHGCVHVNPSSILL